MDQYSPLNEFFGTRIEDVLLATVQVKNIIKRESLVFANDNLWLTRSYRRTDLTHVNALLRQLWPYPNNSHQTLQQTDSLPQHFKMKYQMTKFCSINCITTTGLCQRVSEQQPIQ